MVTVETILDKVTSAAEELYRDYPDLTIYKCVEIALLLTETTYEGREVIESV